MNVQHTPQETSQLLLSVVLVVLDHVDTVRTTLAHLQQQTIADRLELVLVSPSTEDALGLDARAFSCFGAWQLVEVDTLSSAGTGRAEGARHARAPLVWFAEDHGFPAPELAEALVNAHRAHDAIAGLVLTNANPRTMTSWADFFINFGPYTDRTEAEVLGHLAWHKSAYPRDVLLSYGDDLDELLDVEGLLQADLRERGYTLLIEPAAQLDHLNFSKPSSFLHGQLVNGRLYGSTRAKRWSLARRLLYAAGGVLIPALKLRQVLQEIYRANRDQLLIPRILPILSLGVVANSLGEIAGYLFGSGQSSQQKLDMEVKRYRFMTAQDRRDAFVDGSVLAVT